MQMHVNINKAILTLEGKPVMSQGDKILTVGKAIANLLAGPKTKEKKLSSPKAYELSLKFYRQNQIDIDKADFQAIKEMVEGASAYSDLVLAQIIETLNDAKETGDPMGTK